MYVYLNIFILYWSPFYNFNILGVQAFLNFNKNINVKIVYIIFFIVYFWLRLLLGLRARWIERIRKNLKTHL